MEDGFSCTAPIYCGPTGSSTHLGHSETENEKGFISTQIHCHRGKRDAANLHHPVLKHWAWISLAKASYLLSPVSQETESTFSPVLWKRETEVCDGER